MTRIRFRDLLAGSAAVLAACAQSPIGADDGVGDVDAPEVEGEADASPPEDDEGGDDEPSRPAEDDSGEPTVRGPTQGPSNGGDASAPVVRAPAGSGRRDGGNSSAPSGGTDAGASGGESVLGASCTSDSDCNNSCVPVGILPCCNTLNICGCTWAPGAYCL